MKRHTLGHFGKAVPHSKYQETQCGGGGFFLTTSTLRPRVISFPWFSFVREESVGRWPVNVKLAGVR